MAISPKARTHTPSGRKYVEAVEGSTYWGGTIVYNFVDKSNPLDPLSIAEFALWQNAFNVSDATGAGDNAQDATFDGGAGWEAEFMRVANRFPIYAEISFSFEDNNLTPDYFVGRYAGTGDYGFHDFPDPNALPTQVTAYDTTNNALVNGTSDTGGSGDREATFLHEIGHGLGLGHVHDDGNESEHSAPSVFANPAPWDFRYSIMSYTMPPGLVGGTTFGMPATPMPMDVWALQNMYGSKTNNTGDSKYKLTDPGSAPLAIAANSNNWVIGGAYATIWDTGGDEDRIFYSGSNNALINLNDASLAGPGFSGPSWTNSWPTCARSRRIRGCPGLYGTA